MGTVKYSIFVILAFALNIVSSTTQTDCRNTNLKMSDSILIKFNAIDSISYFGQEILDSICLKDSIICQQNGGSGIYLLYLIDFSGEMPLDYSDDATLKYKFINSKSSGNYCLNQEQINNLVIKLRENIQFKILERNFIRFYKQNMTHSSSFYYLTFVIR